MVHLKVKYQNRRNFWACYQTDFQLISGVILGFIFELPKNKSFLVATSESIELKAKSLRSKEPCAKTREYKACF